jgi:hypothetical protein
MRRRDVDCQQQGRAELITARPRWRRLPAQRGRSLVEEARRSGKTDHEPCAHGRRLLNRGCGADSRPRWPDVASLTGRPSGKTGLHADQRPGDDT